MSSDAQQKHSSGPRSKKEDARTPKDKVNAFIQAAYPRCSVTPCRLITDVLKSSHSSPQDRCWDRGVIQFALNLWTNSPRALWGCQFVPHSAIYTSTAVLQSLVKQRPGFHKTVFQWMLDTAMEKAFATTCLWRRNNIRRNVSATRSSDINNRCLTIISALCRLGSTLQQVWLVTGRIKSSWPLDVLQLERLSFLFPLHISLQNGWKHIINLFGEGVKRLFDYRFRVQFCLFDRAVTNCTLMKALFHPRDLMREDMVLDNLVVPAEHIVMGFDCKHASKQIRNNVLRSGYGSDYKPLLIWGCPWNCLATLARCLWLELQCQPGDPACAS